MNLRFLSFAALAGLLAAAGCGGGGTGSGISPTTGNSTIGGATVPTSTARGAITASFLLPIRNVKAAPSSSARTPAYISPGSSGIEVLLGSSSAAGAGGNVSGMGWIIGTPGHPIPLVGTPGASFNGNTFVAGQTGYNASTPAKVTYSYQPSASKGYYTFTVSIVNLPSNSAGTVYEIGVVLTDITHNNFVLSSGQSNAALSFTVGSATQQQVAITLQPVLASAYIAGPRLVTLADSTAANALVFSPAVHSNYELTAYPADELGYVIPAQLNAAGSAQVPFLNTTNWGISNAGTLDFNTFAGTNYATGLAVPLGGTVNPLPLTTTYVAGTLTASASNANVSFGAIPGGLAFIANPAGSNPFQGPVASTSGNVSGWPVNVTADATYTATSSPATFTVYADFPTYSANTTGTAAGTSGFVTGYTYTTGVNIPGTGLTTLATSPPLNFNGGIIPIIQ